MISNVLVFSHQKEFGKLLCNSLNDSNNYHADFVNTSEIQISLFESRVKYETAIMDESLSHLQLKMLSDRLFHICPNIRMILITQLVEPISAELKHFILLQWPFIDQDLLRALKQTPKRVVDLEFETATDETGPERPAHPGSVNKILDGIIECFDIEHICIFNKDQLVASRGCLSSGLVNELKSRVSANLKLLAGNDISSNLTLEQTNLDLPLYSIYLNGGLLLVLLFTLKSQLASVCKKAVSVKSILDNIDPLSITNEETILHKNPILAASNEGVGSTVKIQNTTFETIPLSTKFAANNFTDTLPKYHESYSIPPEGMEFTPASVISYKTVESEPQQNSYHYKKEFSSNSINRTTLNYNCLLIPRFANQYLHGQLVDLLGDWIKKIFISYDWGLMDLDINTSYMHWVVSLEEDVALFSHVYTIRKETSRLIKENRPSYFQDNFSWDFWAKNYKVGSDKNSFSNEAIKDFIKHLRKSDGS